MGKGAFDNDNTDTRALHWPRSDLLISLRVIGNSVHHRAGVQSFLEAEFEELKAASIMQGTLDSRPGAYTRSIPIIYPSWDVEGST